MSRADFDKNRHKFKDAVSWHLPEIDGVIYNREERIGQKRDLDDVRQFEDRIKKQIERVRQQKDHPTYLTVSQIEAIQKQAYDEAYQQGYEEAYKKGTADAEAFLQKETELQRQDLQQKALQLQNAFNTLATPLKDVDHSVEQQLTEMVFYLFRLILDHELTINPEHITRVLQQTMSRLPLSHRDVLIRMNPADIELLKQAEIDIDDSRWQLQADESISAGGCLLESDAVRIDRRLETRMKDLVRQLFNGLDQPVSSSESELDEIGLSSTDTLDIHEDE